MDAAATLRAPSRLAARVFDARLLVHLPVAALVTAYALRFSVLTVSVYDGYGTPPYDMSIPDQGIWLLSRLHAPFSTVMGRDVMADHTSFIFALLVPLFWVYPHAAALLVAQSAMLAAAAIPIYLYALRRLRSAAMATALAAAYLLNPALQWGNLEQFHVECFTVLLVSVGLYAALESRFKLLVVCVGLLFLCKEDVGLIAAPLALWVAWRRSRRLGVGLLAATAAWSVAASSIIYAMVGMINVHTGRLPFGGAGGTIRTALVHPGKFFSYLRSGGRPFYLWQMLSSVGLVLVRAPEIAAVCVLALAVNVITSFGYEHQIAYHYSMPPVPILMMGTSFAIGAMRSHRSRTVATSAVLGCAVVTCYLWGLAPFSRQTYPHLSPASAEVRDIDRVLSKVPPHAVVSAYYPYVAHIDHRRGIYMWPNPFRAEYWNTFHQEGQRLPVADRIEWLVLPTDLSAADGAATFQSIAGSFHVVARAGGVALYERNGP